MNKILIISSCSECKYASEGIRRCMYHSFLKDQFACEFSGIPKNCPLPDAPQPVDATDGKSWESDNWSKEDELTETEGLYER